MKKILLTLATVLIISCSPSDEATPIDCTKGTIIEAQVLNPNFGIVSTIFSVKNDCTGVVTNYNKKGVYKVGDKY